MYRSKCLQSLHNWWLLCSSWLHKLLR